jgi:CP family cyanate transporter-like MFS transporter
VGIAAAGFNLQTAITGVAPILDDIRADMGMSSGAVGLLQTVPFICIAVFALAGLVLVNAMGTERVVAYALALIAIGSVLRALMPLPSLLLIASVPLGLGVALLAVGLPAAVKTYFPDRSGAVTGLYVASLSVGSAAAAVTAVPFSRALGSWRFGLAAGAVPAALALPVWLRATRGRRRDVSLSASLRAVVPGLRSLELPPRPGLTLAALFASQSIVFAGMISWIATLYRGHGWTAAHASIATAVISLVTIPASLLIPGRSDGRDRRPWVFATAAALALGSFAIAFAPMAAPWLWITIFGVGTGAIFPLCLALPLDLARDPNQASLLTAWMLAIGYCFSSASPVVVGTLRDLTGGFTAPTAALGCIAIVTAALSLAGALAPRGESFSGTPTEPARP